MLVSFLSGPCDVNLINSDEIDIAAQCCIEDTVLILKQHETVPGIGMG